MLQILSAGVAYPQTILTDATLAELDPAYAAAAVSGSSDAIVSRRSSLPLDYIRTTGNADVRRAPNYAMESPTDLAFRAAEQALRRAGLRADQIGLVVGDCSTPLQTIPTESQRLLNRYGLKTASYDQIASSGALALHIETVGAYRDDRLPDYVLCFSSNTPTQRVDFRSGSEREYFGDAAGAVVLSTRHSGAIEVLDAFYDTDSSAPIGAAEIFGHLRMRGDDLRAVTCARAARLLEQIRQRHAALLSSPFILIANQIHHAAVEDVVEKAGLTLSRSIVSVNSTGDSIGSSAYCGLADVWDKLASGELVLMIMTGVGQGFGYAILRVKEAAAIGVKASQSAVQNAEAI